jgi:hypothetical protein
VPQQERTIFSARNRVSIVAQEVIQPFRKEESEGKMNQCRIFALPWPKEVLYGLAEQPVRLKVTLSYFVEPSPGKRGWVMKVRRFGSGDTNLIEVPDHVRRIVVEYRLARDLEADPKTSEHDVPLIARLKSEKFVNPWTVANSLLLLEDNANDFSTKKRRQSIVLLRRELIQRSLEASISGRKLSRHLRSTYAVQQVERTLPGDSLVADLDRLAA